jgi:hypothetical protein
MGEGLAISAEAGFGADAEARPGATPRQVAGVVAGDALEFTRLALNSLAPAWRPTAAHGVSLPAMRVLAKTVRVLAGRPANTHSSARIPA